ncbi:MAG TPA: hypothetical protein VI916_13500 [Acidimicrobiia bacterium]|nr:hypothetical protein [Acidimicrobiia bacterium]
MAAVAASTLGAGLLAVVPSSPSAAAPREGLRLVGIVPDDEASDGTNSEGSFWIDPEARILFQFYRHNAGLLFAGTSLDEISNGKFEESFDMLVPRFVGGGLTGTLVGDKSRMDIDLANWEPVVALDTKRGRLFYAAEGAIYELDYDAEAGTHTRAKWVASPHPGNAVQDEQLYVPSGLSPPNGEGTLTPSFGMSFEDGDRPAIYQVGEFWVPPTGQPAPAVRGVWLSGWDASPGNPAASPQVRQDWIYPTSACRSIGREAETFAQTPVFRDGSWLYTFCDGSLDGSARGVFRVQLDPLTGEPNRSTEQFFPGVTGVDVNAFAYPSAGRMYILSRNDIAGGRSVLVFDGRRGNGGYVGAFSVGTDKDIGPAMGGHDPRTGRWYLQSDEGAWLQEGSLTRVAQPAREQQDLDRNLLKFPVRRPIRIDPGQDGRKPRILVERESEFCSRYGLETCIAVYEDSFTKVGAVSTQAENTLNVPETADLVGSYSGIASAFGIRTRVLRGVSTFWPGGLQVQGGSIEGDPPNDPAEPKWYLTDPLFYHGGDCGASDRELTVGRIFQTTLAGGLRGTTASAGALGADPDVHVPSAADDTQTRADLGNPDPCTRYLAEQLMGPNCYTSGATPSDPAQHTWVDLDGDGRQDSAEPYEDQNNNDQWDPGEPYTDLDQDGHYDRDENRCQTDAAYFGVMDPFCRGFQTSDPQHYNQFVQTVGNQCAKRANLSALGTEWPYERVDCTGDLAPPPTVTGLNETPMPTAVSVVCKAGAPQPTVSAKTIAQTAPDPLAQFVSVAQIETSSNLVRVPATQDAPGKGVTVRSEAVLRGITIANLVHIDEFVVTGTAHAEGYATAEGTTADAAGTREFRGVRIGDLQVCASECDTAKVLEQINGAISSLGYVRAADPESDETEGTTKGTLAKLQKDLVQQDADRTMNRDFSTEWVGLEVTVYRDSQRRGTGRWIVELGGVYAQSQFTVIRGLGRNTTPTPKSAAVPRTQPAVKGASLSTPFGVVPARPTAYVAVPAPEPAASIDDASGGGLLDQIAEGFKKSVKMALVLAGLWALVYGPVYLSRRRNLLREIAAR